MGRGGKVRENTIQTGFQNTSVARLTTSRLFKLGEIVESLGSQRTQRESIRSVETSEIESASLFTTSFLVYIKNESWIQHIRLITRSLLIHDTCCSWNCFNFTCLPRALELCVVWMWCGMRYVVKVKSNQIGVGPWLSIVRWADHCHQTLHSEVCLGSCVSSRAVNEGLRRFHNHRAHY